MIGIVLGEESAQALCRTGFQPRLRKVRAVAEMQPAAHHREIDAQIAALDHRDHDVHVRITMCMDRTHILTVQHRLQRPDLVAQLSRLFEVQRGRCRLHLTGQLLDHFAVPALEEQLGQLHVCRVIFRRHQTDARRLAALDLMQQAGPRTVGEHRFLAGTQQEGLLDQLD